MRVCYSIPSVDSLLRSWILHKNISKKKTGNYTSDIAALFVSNQFKRKTARETFCTT